MAKDYKKVSQAALKEAIRMAGGIKELAELLKVPYSTVWSWLRPSKQVPAEWCIPIEKALRREITRYDLRPDIYYDE